MSAKRTAQRTEKMADANMGSLSARHIFRGIEFIVSMFVRDDLVAVEAEDRLTADQWRAEFDARCKISKCFRSSKYSVIYCTVIMYICSCIICVEDIYEK
jgi:hypothetical protein